MPAGNRPSSRASMPVPATRRPDAREAMPDLPSRVLSEARLDAAARHAGDIWLPEHPYFDAAEPDFDIIWQSIAPFLEGADFACVLDLATGRGRNARRLLPLARRLILVDIRPENIAF